LKEEAWRKGDAVNKYKCICRKAEHTSIKWIKNLLRKKRVIMELRKYWYVSLCLYWCETEHNNTL